MNRLWTFGCSFTEDFRFFFEKIEDTSRKKYVVDYCDNKPPDTWNESLSKKLNYELKNFGGVYGVDSGNGREENCNESIFNNVCHLSNEFKKDDIVIIEWTFIERFKWARDETNRMVSILPSNYKYINNDEVIEGILINRSSKLWIEEIFKKIKIINTLSQNVGFKVFYWTVDKNITNYKLRNILEDNKWLLNINFGYDKYNRGYKDIVFELGGKTISEETNNIINDDHFGKTAHNVMSDLFYIDIKNKML